MHPWRSGRSEQGGEGKSSKADMHCAWTTNWVTTISKVNATSVECTYTEELLSGSLRSPVEPWERYPRCTLSNALNNIGLTSRDAEGLDSAPVEVWAWRRRRRGGEELQSRYASRVDYELGYNHQRSQCDICGTYIQGGVALRVVTQSSRPGEDI